MRRGSCRIFLSRDGGWRQALARDFRIAPTDLNGKIDHLTGVVAMKTPIDQYFDHIESVAGEGGIFYRIEDDPKIVVAAYPDVPESGCLTAFSYGLSSAERKEWKNSRPELVISVDSKDTAWAIAMGEIIRNGRGECLFSYGEIFNFDRPVSDESGMSSFLVFACDVLDSADLKVILSDRIVYISQIYPIYKEETATIKALGGERFFTSLSIDFFNTKRAPVILN